MESSLNALRFPLVALVMIVAAGCGKTPEATQSAAAPPAVSVAQVIKHQVTEWDELTGRLEAPESVEIRPRVSGFIDKVAFEEGALVKKGDLLFQIDPRPFEAQVKRLEAELQQARAIQQRTASEPSGASGCASTTRFPPNWPTPGPVPPARRNPRRRRSRHSWRQQGSISASPASPHLSMAAWDVR